MAPVPYDCIDHTGCGLGRSERMAGSEKILKLFPYTKFLSMGLISPFWKNWSWQAYVCTKETVYKPMLI